LNAVKRRQPFVPPQAFARAEGFDDMVFIEPERGSDLESRRHENGALVMHQDHALRRRQGVSLLLGIVGDIAAGRLVGEPFADIALANAGCLGKRHRRTGAEVGHLLIQTELAPYIDQHAGKSGAKVGNDLADEGFDLTRRGGWCELGHDLVLCVRMARPAAGRVPWRLR
jgi:hypothetical protein